MSLSTSPLCNLERSTRQCTTSNFLMVAMVAMVIMVAMVMVVMVVMLVLVVIVVMLVRTGQD